MARQANDAIRPIKESEDPRPKADTTAPLVSVVVPARNEFDSIGPCLRSIQEQSFSDIEIIVVDALSDDGTASVVEGFAKLDARIRLVQNPARVTPAALNLGLLHARGKYLVRIDAHAIPAPDYVERIVRHLASGAYAGVGGVKIAAGGDTRRGRTIAAALTSRFGVGGSAYHYASTPTETDHIPFGAYRVDLLRRLNGWNPLLLVNQDFELDYRIRQTGAKLLLDPQIQVLWKTSQTLSALAYQYRRYGRGKALVARLHPSSLKLRHLLPVGGIVGVVASVLVSLTLMAPWPLLLDVPYVAFLVIGAVKHSGFRRISFGRVLAPIVLTIMHLAWGFGFLEGMIKTLVHSEISDPYRLRDLSQPI